MAILALIQNIGSFLAPFIKLFILVAIVLVLIAVLSTVNGFFSEGTSAFRQMDTQWVSPPAQQGGYPFSLVGVMSGVWDKTIGRSTAYTPHIPFAAFLAMIGTVPAVLLIFLTVRLAQRFLS